MHPGETFEAWFEGVDQPLGLPPLDVLGRLERFKLSARVRSAIPLRVAIAWASLRSRRRFRRDPTARERALRWATAHVVGESTPGATEALARSAAREAAIQDLLRWRRRVPRRTRIIGFEQLARARDPGRGALIVALRQGPTFALPELLARRLGRVYFLIGRDPRAERTMTHHKAWLKAHWRHRAERAGVRFLGAAEPESDVAELLRRGMVAFTFFDRPGPRATGLLDRTFSLAERPSTLAFAAGVPVFPAIVVRRRARLHVELLPRLEPRADWTPEELHAGIADALDPALRAHLAQLFPAVLPTAEGIAERAARAERKASRRMRAAVTGSALETPTE